MQTVTTETLEIGYETDGPADGRAVILLHGWPDDARAWKGVTPLLARSGFRTFAPYLRGFGLTRYLSRETVRDGSAVALAHDVIDFANALALHHFAFVGHDWGGRVAYVLAALWPERVRSITSISVAYAPHGELPVPDYEQCRHYWYHWFMNVDQGAEKFRNDVKGFTRFMWEHWSPKGWFSDTEFAATAKSFENPDFVDTVLSSYRSRWEPRTPRDVRYDPLRKRLAEVGTLSTPTLVVHGCEDGASLAKTTREQHAYFRGPYRHIELSGVGHFVPREVASTLAELVLAHLREHA